MAACGLNGAKESSGMKYGRLMRDGYVKPNESKVRSVDRTRLRVRLYEYDYDYDFD